MDPLSVTASIIAVLQATEAVIILCCNYRSACKNASWELPRILEETRSLRDILRRLEELADKAEASSGAGKPDLQALQHLCQPQTGALPQCLQELASLEAKLKPPGWTPIGSKRSALAQALVWPLRKAETERTLKSIEYFKSTLSLALSLDQTYVCASISFSASILCVLFLPWQKVIKAPSITTMSSWLHVRARP